VHCPNRSKQTYISFICLFKIFFLFTCHAGIINSVIKRRVKIKLVYTVVIHSKVSIFFH
jgi:hypothetical protein